MKINDALTAFQVAGYHGDIRRYTELLIENRISKARASEHYLAGKRKREAGVPCGCRTCKVTA